VPRVRLLDGRILAAAAGDVPVRFQALGSGAATLGPLNFDVYSLPAELLSALGAGAAGWPSAMPAGFPESLQKVHAVSYDPAGTEDAVSLGALPAGLYLVVVTSAAQGTAYTTDWALLAVSDHALTFTGEGSPLWATDAAGRAWAGAEVSLSAPSGALLEKGPTNEFGLWQPTTASVGAALAVARDPAGHTAAMLVPEGARWDAPAPGDLAAALVTDLPAYRPGETVNFRAILRPGTTAPATPVAEQEVSVVLLAPGGAAVSSLTLKPDSVGAVGGIFPLSAGAQAGQYTVRVRAAGAQHDFPLAVVERAEESLSVYVVPGPSVMDDTTITRTVSVLGTAGVPAAGAVVTASLIIAGDTWAAEPVTGTTDADGRVTLVAPMPGWFTRFNEPALALAVEASKGSLSGTALHYVDLTSQSLAQTGMTQLVAPDLNVAVVARPMGDAPFKVRVVLLDDWTAAGDVLVTVRSASGEQLAYSLDLARLVDATIEIPQRFSGGTLTVQAAGREGSRTLRLVPGLDSEAILRVVAPETVTAGADFPVRLAFTDLDGRAVSGGATLWMRRVSGALPEGPQPWEPSLAITSSGAITHTLQAPNGPGLWYVMSEAVTPDGARARSWSVLRVEPGPWVQGPPAHSATVGEAATIWTTVHNPAPNMFSSGVRTVEQGSVRVVSGSSQPLEVPAGEWRRLSWRVVSAQGGEGRIGFAFMPSSRTAGLWTATVRAVAGPRTDFTYTAGVMTGERTVGVSVPSGLAAETVRLEIHASTSMLPALAAAAASPSESSISSAAARLSGVASVASAYARLNAEVPESAALSTVERAVLLQQIYSAQRADGGWGSAASPDGPSSVGHTGEVLLALQRMGAYSPPGVQAVQPDLTAVNRALTYLASEMARPADPKAGAAALDERAFGMYVLAVHRPVPAEVVRPMMVHAGGHEGGLTPDGEAWLALALWQSGNSADALAVVNHMMRSAPQAAEVTPAMLEAVLEAQRTLPALAARPTDLPDYDAAAAEYARALMEARQGAGWATPGMTAHALAALSRYVVARGDAPEGGTPALELGDRPVQASPASGNTATVSVVLTGNELHPGMNWLTLKAPTPDRTLYYSLALTATR
ncbi:MAG TPA: MG2 domain-containing protein, partial [Chloroflexia bacterium]|nr:MG2 domain-containing protein [Chloroflexia bacterium]